MYDSFKCATGIYSSYKTHQQSLATVLKYVGGRPELLPPVAKPVCALTGGKVGWRGNSSGLRAKCPRVDGLKNGTMAEESGRDLFFKHRRRAASSGWRPSFATSSSSPSSARMKLSSHLSLFHPPSRHLPPPRRFKSRPPMHQYSIDHSK